MEGIYRRAEGGPFKKVSSSIRVAICGCGCVAVVFLEILVSSLAKRRTRESGVSTGEERSVDDRFGSVDLIPCT